MEDKDVEMEEETEQGMGISIKEARRKLSRETSKKRLS